MVGYGWEDVRGRGSSNKARRLCGRRGAPIVLRSPPSCTRAAAAAPGTYTLREREGHRPRLQGTAIRVAPTVGIAHYHSIGRHAAAARGCRLCPSGTGDVGPIGVCVISVKCSADQCRRPPLDQGGWSSESVSHGCIGHDTEADWHQSAPGTPERRLLALEVILD